MSDQFIRTRLLVGDEPLERLKNAKVAVFGVGGVGGYAVEALARSGVGTLHLYDDDTVSESNLNRQLAALHSTIGQPKAEVMAGGSGTSTRPVRWRPSACFTSPKTRIRWIYPHTTTWWTASTQ